MSAVPSWFTVNPPFPSLASQSPCLGFSAAHPLLPRNVVVSSLTSTRPRPSTRQLRNAELFMAMVDSDSSYRNPDYAEIIIVRHGETEWNAYGKIQGHLDVELNDAGREQAVAVADRLSKEPNISAVYSSDLKRALETAEMIAIRHGGLEVIKDTGLRERHLGDLQGHVFRDTAKVCPEAYEAFVSPRKDQEIPGGGESRDQLYQRCTSTLLRIGRKHKGQRIILVTHGGFIRTLYRWACPNEKSAGKVLNTSVNVFRLADGDKWTLEVWGDVSHLEQTGYLQSGFGGDRNSG